MLFIFIMLLSDVSILLLLNILAVLLDVLSVGSIDTVRSTLYLYQFYSNLSL